MTLKGLIFHWSHIPLTIAGYEQRSVDLITQSLDKVEIYVRWKIECTETGYFISKLNAAIRQRRIALARTTTELPLQILLFRPSSDKVIGFSLSLSSYRSSWCYRVKCLADLLSSFCEEKESPGIRVHKFHLARRRISRWKRFTRSRNAGGKKGRRLRKRERGACFLITRFLIFL